MRHFWRRSVTVVALYAVALHVILLAFLPIIPGSFLPVDPFAIICQTTGAAAKPDQPPPGKLHFLPGRVIDHCDLCSAAPPPPAPDVASSVDFRAARVLHVFSPLSAPGRSGFILQSKLIRGPPLASS
jgi:hypothetical protein